ncbi:MAG: hypothetical protein IPO21_00495 [Bacteroidales bacterium]|nr:hypothetical protein [Bacteroidales bacterium]
MKKIFFLITTSFFFIKINAQTMDLSLHPNVIPVTFIFVVDFLQLDSAKYNAIQLTEKDIKKYKFYENEHKFLINTKLLVILDKKELLDTEDKKENLSIVNKDSVKSIERLSKDEAIESYGKKGKHGALIIETKY